MHCNRQESSQEEKNGVAYPEMPRIRGLTEINLTGAPSPDDHLREMGRAIPW
jgi:hypothetical protein